MLCPETWDFKSPRHRFFTDSKDIRKGDIPPVVKTHYFNHSISVVLPDTVTIPDNIQNCLSEDTDYYWINSLRACDLVNREFIEAFVKKNFICVTPTGYLVLSLVIEDYQALGLEGKPSSFDRKPQTRYDVYKSFSYAKFKSFLPVIYIILEVVTINLKNESFIPGKKNYEKTRSALNERLKQNFDVIISWDPPEINLCPSSVAAWFHARNYKVRPCRQKFSQKTEYTLNIPTTSSLESEFNKYDEFFEWLGVFSIGGDISNNEIDDYVNTYKCPTPFIRVGEVQYLQWTGFFTRKKVEDIYNVLQKYILSRNTLPWVSLDLQGFINSPITWNLTEHMFLTDGDNSYTIIFRPKVKSIIRQNLSQ